MKIKDTALDRDQLEATGIPGAFLNFQVDTYSGSRAALEDCHKFAINFAKARSSGLGLFIRGASEAQKTFLATYVLRVLLAQGTSSVAYLSFPDLADKVLANETTVRAAVAKPLCLVLDNLNPSTNKFWPTLLERVLSIRKDEGKPTLFVTQLVKDFEHHYGAVNLRTIEHMSHTVWAEMDDAQKAKAEAKRKTLFVDEVGE